MGAFDVFQGLRGPARGFRDTRLYGSGHDVIPAGVPGGALPFNPERLIPRPSRRVGAKSGDFSQVQQSVGVGNLTAILERPEGERVFLAIQNTHAVNTLFLSFGSPASSTVGLSIAPGGAWAFDVSVPQNAVYLSGSAAGTTASVTFCDVPITQE